MKKLLASLLLASSLCLAGCSASESSSSAKSSLQGNGYTVSVYSESETKARFQQFDYSGFTLTDCVYATKGTGDNADFLLAFFFSNIEDAPNFVMKGDNIRLLNSAIEQLLGKNLTAKYGSHNNVAYAGSETSFSAAF